MIDEKFTQELQTWVNTPDDEQDFAAGAMLLLRLTNNRALYARLLHAGQRQFPFLRAQLRKYLDYRLRKMTKEQVAQMETKVEEIVERNIPLAAKADQEQAKGRKGKRDDHESLPEDIQALFTENLSILQRMRQVHMRLRDMTCISQTCPASDRYPFLKELIDLDKKLRANWKAYDQYIPANEKG